MNMYNIKVKKTYTVLLFQYSLKKGGFPLSGIFPLLSSFSLSILS
jgi:hypothetical protein